MAGIIFWILAVADLSRLKAAVGCLFLCAGISLALAELFPDVADEIGRIAVFVSAFFGLSLSILMLLKRSEPE